MFFTVDNRDSVPNLVFTWEDPRRVGYQGNVFEGVGLDYDMAKVHLWNDGEARPEACVGRDPKNPNYFKVFKYRSELQDAGYQPLSGRLFFGSWSDYLKLHHPEDLIEEDWYQSLDRYDAAARRRRERAQVSASPRGKNRDDVAAWVARKHLIADSSIREVWYLPRGAPSEEIRFLELNDRLVSVGPKAEAIDFGLEVDGARYRLFVADVDSEQIDQIKHDPSRLPQGWSIEDKQVWRRGA